jgi:hypothetical protein
MRIRSIIARRRKALQTSNPKQRDKLRHDLKIALVAAQLKREAKNEAT